MMDEFHHRPGKGGLNSRVNRRLRDIYDRAGVLLITQLQNLLLGREEYSAPLTLALPLVLAVGFPSCFFLFKTNHFII